MRNRLLVIGLSLAVMALTCLPYVAALSLAKPGQHFAGFIWGVDDGNVYLSWIRQASEGRWLLRDQYTVEAQNPHFFNAFLLVLGGVCRLTGLAPAIVFHLARVLCGVLCLSSVYALAAWLLGDRRLAWLAWAFAAFSSGFGWLIVALVKGGGPSAAPLAHPVDLAEGWQAQPEAVTFLTLLLNPLFCLAVGLLCLVFLFALRALDGGRWRDSLLAGVFLLILGNAHSYDVFVVYAALALWLVWGLIARQVKPVGILHLALIFAISAPGPIWAWYTGHADPSYLAKTETPTKSAQPLDYALSYGLVTLLAIFGFLVSLRPKRGRFAWQFPVIWVAVNAALLYAPVPFQRKLAEGLHIPLCLLAALGLGSLLWGRTEKPYSPICPESRGDSGDSGERGERGAGGVRTRTASESALIAALAVLLTVPSNAFFISDCLGHMAQNNLDLLQTLMPPAYLDADDAAGMQWLGEHAQESDVILSTSLIGNHIPAHASCLVLAGHWAETLHFGRALAAVSLFFVPGQTNQVREDILSHTGATYVYQGPYERMLQEQVAEVYPQISRGRTTDDFRDLAGRLQPVFRSGGVMIFRVMASTAGGAGVSPALGGEWTGGTPVPPSGTPVPPGGKTP